jgi:hypothetical protein
MHQVKQAMTDVYGCQLAPQDFDSSRIQCGLEHRIWNVDIEKCRHLAEFYLLQINLRAFYNMVCSTNQFVSKVDSVEKKLGTYDKSAPSLLERVIDGVLRPLLARVSFKITDFRGDKISWEFVRVPAISSMPDGNSPSH